MAHFLANHEPRKFIAAYFDGLKNEIEEDYKNVVENRKDIWEDIKSNVEEKKGNYLKALDENEKECLENYEKNTSQILSSLEEAQNEEEFLKQLKKKLFENMLVFYFRRTPEPEGVYLGKLFVVEWFIEDQDLDYIKKTMNTDEQPKVFNKANAYMNSIRSNLWGDEVVKITREDYINQAFSSYSGFEEIDSSSFVDFLPIKALRFYSKFKHLTRDHFKNFKSVEEISLDLSETETIEKSIFADLENLTSISFSGSNNPQLFRNALSEIPKVKKLEITFYNFETEENKDQIINYENVFDSCSSLEHLQLSARIGAIPNGFFDKLENLTYLSLNGNCLKSLDANIFKNLIKLDELDLGNNQLTSLDANIFSNLTNLSRLTLSYNQIEEIPVDLFKNLTNLKFLTLSSNEISSIPKDAFVNLINLEELHISSNYKINAIDATCFDPLTNLSTFVMYSDDLRELNLNWFKNKPNLTTINVEQNNFESYVAIDEKMPNIIGLQLRQGFLTEIKKDLLQPFENLTTFEAHWNQIEKIELPLLKDLTNLNLEKNQLKSVKKEVFENVPSLEYLRLCQNQIEEIEAGAFSTLSKLESLTLEENKLTSVSKETFEGLSALRTLDISRNQIESLSIDVFEGLPKLETITLDEKCANESLTAYFEKRNIQFYSIVPPTVEEDYQE